MPTSVLLSLDDAKANLNNSSNVNDAELLDVIDEATEIIEDLTGPILARQYTESFYNIGNPNLGAYANAVPSAFGTRVQVRHPPLLSVQSVSTSYLGVATGMYTTGISFDPPTGVVWLTAGTPLYGDVTVAYTAGLASVPRSVRRATKELVRHIWETQRGSSTARPSYDEQATQTPSGFLVPNRVVEALNPHLRAPVVG